MTPTQKAVLRQKAEQATPGPWEWRQQLGRDEMPVLDGADGKVCDFGDDTQYYPTEGVPPCDMDAAYIAAAHPAAILDLLDENERLREALGWVRDIAASVQHGHVGGQQAGTSMHNMTPGTKREILRTLDAALAEPPA